MVYEDGPLDNQRACPKCGTMLVARTLLPIYEEKTDEHHTAERCLSYVVEQLTAERVKVEEAIRIGFEMCDTLDGIPFAPSLVARAALEKLRGEASKEKK